MSQHFFRILIGLRRRTILSILLQAQPWMPTLQVEMLHPARRIWINPRRGRRNQNCSRACRRCTCPRWKRRRRTRGRRGRGRWGEGMGRRWTEASCGGTRFNTFFWTFHKSDKNWWLAFVDINTEVPSQNTGWPFRLCQTSRWHQNKSSVLIWGAYTKTQHLFWCQREVCHNLNGHPVLCCSKKMVWGCASTLLVFAYFS